MSGHMVNTSPTPVGGEAMPWKETNPVLERHHFAQDLERVARPPAANLNLQQRAFNHFRTTYNELRPHEALDDETPASRWKPSARPYPERIAPPEYPGHFEVRKVSTAGTFRLHSGQHFLSQALNEEYVGFEEIKDGLWNIVYYDTLFGRFDEQTGTITGAPSLRKKC